MTKGWTRCLVSLGAVLLCVPAGAAEPTRSATSRTIVVIDLSDESKEAREIAREVRRAVGAHQNAQGELDYAPREVHGPLNAGGEVRARQSIATAMGLIDAGLAGMDAEDYEDASDQLMSAARLIEDSLAVVDDDTLYGRVLLLLGESRLRAGDEEGAAPAFRKAVIAGADPSGSSDAARAAFERAKREVAAAPRGAARIVTTPPYAEVHIDGEYRGISPRAVDGLAEGEHLVTVFKAGFERETARITVSAGGQVTETIELTPARRALLLDELRPRLAEEIATLSGDPPLGGDAVRDVGSLFRTEAVLVMRVDGTAATKDLELTLFDEATRRMVASERVRGMDWSFHNRAAIERAVNALLALSWVEVLGGEVAEDPAAGGDSVTSEWWFWTLIGAAVAGGTVAAILLTSGDDPPAPFERDGSGAIVLRF